MIPLLLYAPPLIEVGALDIKSVAGVTMTQVLVAATAGVLAHRRHRTVNRDLAWAGGPAMAAGSLAGALVSQYVHERWLLLVFALMVTGAAFLMFVPVDGIDHTPDSSRSAGRARRSSRAAWAWRRASWERAARSSWCRCSSSSSVCRSV